MTQVPPFSLLAVELSRPVHIRDLVNDAQAWCPGDPKSCLTRERVSAEPVKEALSIRWGWPFSSSDSGSKGVGAQPVARVSIAQASL